MDGCPLGDKREAIKNFIRKLRNQIHKKTWSQYKKFKNVVNIAIEEAQPHYLESVLSVGVNDAENKENKLNMSKKFWDFIRGKRKEQSGTPPLQQDGKTFTPNKDKAEVLNNFFQSFFMKDDGKMMLKSYKQTLTNFLLGQRNGK